MPPRKKTAPKPAPKKTQRRKAIPKPVAAGNDLDARYRANRSYAENNGVRTIAYAPFQKNRRPFPYVQGALSARADPNPITQNFMGRSDLVFNPLGEFRQATFEEVDRGPPVPSGPPTESMPDAPSPEQQGFDDLDRELQESARRRQRVQRELEGRRGVRANNDATERMERELQRILGNASPTSVDMPPPSPSVADEPMREPSPPVSPNTQAFTDAMRPLQEEQAQLLEQNARLDVRDAREIQLANLMARNQELRDTIALRLNPMVPMQTPVQTPEDTPADTPVQTPMQSPPETPVASPEQMQASPAPPERRSMDTQTESPPVSTAVQTEIEPSQANMSFYDDFMRMTNSRFAELEGQVQSLQRAPQPTFLERVKAALTPRKTPNATPTRRIDARVSPGRNPARPLSDINANTSQIGFPLQRIPELDSSRRISNVAPGNTSTPPDFEFTAGPSAEENVNRRAVSRRIGTDAEGNPVRGRRQSRGRGGRRGPVTEILDGSTRPQPSAHIIGMDESTPTRPVARQLFSDTPGAPQRNPTIRPPI